MTDTMMSSAEQLLTVGTCSLCGGRVVRKMVWLSDGNGPAPAWCTGCGAVEKNRTRYGAEIEMVKRP